MPQGGINQNENFLQAAKRELEEETEITSVELVKELNEWLEYDLPENLLGKVLEGKYRGQKQKWFIMKFIGIEDEINIKTKNAEFKEWKWVDIDQLTNVVVKFKIDVYRTITSELSKLNLN